MSDTTEMLKSMLDVAALRHRVIANNLANVNTPGYQRKSINFKAAFEDAVKKGGFDETKVSPELKVDTTKSRKANGNNVSTQREMGLMTENNLLYAVSSKALARKYAGLRKAIRGK